MTLTLRIENFDVMENGGPMSITLRGHGCTAGRGKGMDWQLPDPARHVSSHHFDISFAGGQYYLTDVSTNGTFLQGQTFRLDGAHQIVPGDRFVVGPYLIGVQLEGAASSVAQPPAAPPGAQMQAPPAPAPEDDDPWAAFAPAPAQPVDPLPATRGGADDIGQQRVDLGPPPPIRTPGAPPPPAPAADPAAQPAPQVRPAGLSMPPSAPPPVQPATPVQPPAMPQGLSMPPLTTPPLRGAGLSTPPRPASAPPPAPPAAAAAADPMAPEPEPVPMPSPDAPRAAAPPPAAPPPSPFSQAASAGYAPAGAAAPSDPASQEAILRAFCQGAGLSYEAHANTDAVALAEELGRVVRLATTDIMAMLTDRAAVKQFTKGGERTMRSAKGNNPMKFLPDPEQAIETMFLRPRDGFMRGTDGFSNALRDVRSHQAAVFAALQPALAHVLSGLSPDEIQGTGSSGLLGGSGKSKSWETYVARWDEKAEKGDHGMLDSFLEAFAKAYAQAVARDDP